MAASPDREWEERKGLVALGEQSIQSAVDAFIGSLPTLLHAKRFFEVARERLGRQAVASGDANRLLR